MSSDNTVRTLVELPNELVDRIYAIESNEETIQDRIEEMVQHFEPATKTAQCPYEFPPLDNGVVLRCQHTAGHNGECEPYADTERAA